MKLLIVSDIHGDYLSFKKALENETFDTLIVLGDLFSYGYEHKKDDEEKIIDTLQKYKDKLILIKGNCDYLISFEALSLHPFEVITLPFNNHIITFTHGNKYKKGFLPTYHGDIFISGHTHVPLLMKENNITYVNPGSTGHPRGGSSKSYAVFDNDVIVLKTIDNKIIKEMKVG
jgi:putative phosphoesterase